MASTSNQEGILRTIWESVVPSEDPDWVERVAALPVTSEPLGDYGEVVRSMLRAGVPATTIARLARIVGYEAVFGALYELDGEACPGGHEMLLTLDPTGREMRPPPSSPSATPRHP